MANEANGDKRTVMTDALETLGIIGPNEARDAIHLAVEPVTAEHELQPGENVAYDGQFAYGVGRDDPEAVGIVDPFLRRGPRAGEKFWLVVYPRQIKSLRHVWEHPAFPSSRDLAPGPAAIVPTPEARNHAKLESEKWLRDFCTWADCPGYEATMERVREHVQSGGSWDDDYIHFDGRDAHGAVPPEFWEHYETVTGTKVPEGRKATSFSCSC